jgi:hypothetical protein
MTGNEFFDGARAYARRHGLTIEFDPGRDNRSAD